MEETLGVKFHEMIGEETIQAEMMVDERTCQPFGRINGGASLALAEMLAGHGSFYLCSDDERPVGVQISGNHVGWATVGEKVVATAHIEHRGQTTHVWNVTIDTESGRPVSIVRVTNMILKEPPKAV
ncbi:MAG: PaaI family thioesterase [Bacteroidales bacterium]|nr:PaaI family thioesterase [Bacteroidales bacterium]